MFCDKTVFFFLSFFFSFSAFLSFNFFRFLFLQQFVFLSISGKRLLFFFFSFFSGFLFWDEQCTVFWFRFGFREAHWFETYGYRFEEGIGADVQTRDTGRKGSDNLQVITTSFHLQLICVTGWRHQWR